jgi:transcriptional regulator with XRE-family HTH domain
MIGARVRDRRKEIGLSIAELTRRSELSRSAVSEIEKGSQPRSDTLIRIARSLDVSTDFLAKGEEFTERELVVHPELASMADHHGLTFTQAHCLMRVAKVLEQSSSKFQLKPVHVDWMKLYRDIEDWL